MHSLTKCPDLRQLIQRLLVLSTDILPEWDNAQNFEQTYKGCLSSLHITQLVRDDSITLMVYEVTDLWVGFPLLEGCADSSSFESWIWGDQIQRIQMLEL